jgi:hypothetical protein
MLNTILRKACEAADWDYGEVWFIDRDTEILHLGDAWFVRAGLSADRKRSWEQFRACSEKFALRLGEGIPGRVGQFQRPEWIDDVSVQSESYFLRNQIAIAFGVKAGFGLPLGTNSGSVVLVFFLSEAQPQDDSRIAATQAAIAQMELEHQEIVEADHSLGGIT